MTAVLGLDELAGGHELADHRPSRSGPRQEGCDRLFSHGMHRRDAQQIALDITGESKGIPLVPGQDLHPRHLLAEDLVGPVESGFIG